MYILKLDGLFDWFTTYVIKSYEKKYLIYIKYFKVLSSAKYEELVDKDGNLILPKHEEHTVLAVRSTKL